MPRLIDEDRLKHSIWEYTDKYGHIEMTITFFNILLERNRVDAVEVVRCKDCKSAERKCKWYCVKRQNIVNDDDFCSWGERKEDAEIH